jgi:hypothetical protein
MNWGELKTDIRSDLQDTANKYSDTLLFLYVKDAIRDYSVWFPKRADRELLSRNGSGYSLPNTFIEEIYVETPLDTYLEKRIVHPGTVRKATLSPRNYYIQGGMIYLSALEYDEPVYLTYFATHPVPTSESDDAFVVSIPDMDIELIRIYVKAKLYERIRAKQASLDRFKPVGTRDDNPIIPEVADLMREYEKGISERIGGGTVFLQKVSRN